MTAHEALEQALAALIETQTGEPWPVTGWVLYASITDPETMVVEEGFWATSRGQHTAMTRGLLEQARDRLLADAVSSVTYSDWEPEDDNEGD